MCPSSSFITRGYSGDCAGRPAIPGVPYSEDPGPGEVTLLSETEWTTDDEDTEDPMDETMEQKCTTDSGAGQDLEETSMREP